MAETKNEQQSNSFKRKETTPILPPAPFQIIRPLAEILFVTKHHSLSI